MRSHQHVTLHIGVSRTGTTTLQKHLFPLLHGDGSWLYLGKSPNKPTIALGGLSFSQVTSFFSATCLDNASPRQRRLALSFLASLAQSCSSTNPAAPQCAKVLDACLKNLLFNSSRHILVSTEMLSEIGGPSTHGSWKKNLKKRFPVYAMVESFNRIGVRPKVLVALREPLGFLGSKYARACGLRASQGMEFITPAEFIFNQAYGEAISPGASALATASHKTFVEQLAVSSMVYPVAFSTLISSRNALKTLELSDDYSIGFADLPRENESADHLAGWKQNELSRGSLRSAIAEALERVGWLEKLLSNQMYD